VIVGWGHDWSRRPQTRAEIQSNYRERKKKGNESPSERYQDEVTSYQSSNALPSREEREERESAVTRNDSLSLPEGFEPSEKARRIAADRRLDLAHELAQFRDHANAHGWTARNWESCFCKWLRNSKDVDRKSDKGGLPIRATTGPHVTRQRTVDGVKYVLTERDGNMREISETEALELKQVQP
jgi:hypothetical protein